MQLLGSPQADAGPLPSIFLTADTVTLRWVSDPAKYLGFPTTPYRPRLNTYGRVKVHGPWVRQRLGFIRYKLLATINGLTFCASPLGHVSVIQQYVLNKALYSAPVLRLETDSLDRCTNKHLRSVLLLPPTFPSLLLRWELRFLPSDLQVLQRALRHVHTLVNHAWFFKDFIQPLLDPAPRLTPLRTQMLSRGPLHRLHALLNQFRDHLLLPTDRRDSRSGYEEFALWRVCSTLSKPKWHERVSKAIWTEFEKRVTDDLNSHPTSEALLSCRLPPPSPSTRTYLQDGGSLALIGLRFKGPSLDFHKPRTAPKPCQWCLHAQYGELRPEHGHHLLRCPAMPAPLAARRQTLLAQIALEAPLHDSPLDALSSLSWTAQPATLHLALEFMADLLRAYVADLPEASRRRIRAIPVSA